MSEQKTILLIDDEKDFVYMLEGILKREGYYVVTASNGAEGLAKLKQMTPHLIILDMNMPRMSGIDFYHAITNSLDGKTWYPVLVLTARANLEKLFQDLNVDGFLNKPFDISELLNEIKIILAKRYGEIANAPEKNLDSNRQKKILIIDDNKINFDRLVLTMVNGGYLVSGSQSGVIGIERAMGELPDIILIKLGRSDLSWDVVASKLKQMPKTTDIPIILYTSNNEQTDNTVVKKLCEKIGIKRLVTSDDGHFLLKEIDSIFQH